MQQFIAFFRRFRVFLVFIGLQIFALSTYVQYLRFPQSQYLTSASYVAGKFYGVRYSIMKHFNLDNSNKNLQAENAILRKQTLNNLYQINRYKFHVADTVYEQQYDFISCLITNSNTSKINNYFTLDGGELQGIERGMGVFSQKGVIGVVHNTSEHYSVVKSVLTKDINIDVLVLPVGLYGFLKWDGKDPKRGTITGITNDLSIKKGSKVVTRGGAGIFPKGLLVGYVEKLVPVEGKPLWEVVIRFSEDYRRLDRVYVIKNLFIKEQLLLENANPKDNTTQ
jgi:rod shape-determining protein MreC